MSQNIIILGSGESALGAAMLAQQQGYVVFVSDKNEMEIQTQQSFKKLNIEFEHGNHSMERILSADLVVKSPGIPDHIDLIQQILDKGIEVISEIEFAYRYSSGKIIAITGSNGKTTTASLIYHILKNAGKDVALCGNIGTSFARVIAEEPRDWYVIELSSFQLDGCVHFKPDIAIICNITEDHLDRYDFKFENYIRSKFIISQNQTQEDYLIYNADDEITTQYLHWANNQVQKIPIAINKKIDKGGFIENDTFIINTDKQQIIMPIQEFALKGTHNAYNSMAAGITSKLVGIRKAAIRESLENFERIEHRLEYINTVDGVQYINDSKATNVNSTWYALETMNDSVVWIAGGVDKGNDYTILKKLVEQKVKAIICLGIDNEKLRSAFSDVVGYIVEVDNAKDAVLAAQNISEAGDTVLLSPACASFDLFENYEDRGNQFKKHVRNL